MAVPPYDTTFQVDLDDGEWDSGSSCPCFPWPFAKRRTGYRSLLDDGSGAAAKSSWWERLRWAAVEIPSRSNTKKRKPAGFTYDATSYRLNFDAGADLPESNMSFRS